MTGSAFADDAGFHRTRRERSGAEGEEEKTALGDTYKRPYRCRKNSPPKALPPKLDVVFELSELVRLDRLVPGHDHLPHELSTQRFSTSSGYEYRARRTWRNFPSYPAETRQRSAQRSQQEQRLAHSPAC